MRHPVTFAPAGLTVWVDDGATVLEAARQAGVSLAASCGGRGTCGGCGVRVLDGTLGQPDDVEFAVLPKLPKAVRLACRARIVGPVSVEPLVKFRAPSTGSDAPASRATSLYDFEDDDFDDSPDSLDTSPRNNPERLVAAVDLGTTNVSAAVIEVISGVEVGRATLDNYQRSWGADVLTRLSASMAGDRDDLRDAAQRCVMECVAEAAGEPFSSLFPRLDRLVVSANAVMAPLFTGQDASGLSAAPFVPPTDLALVGGPLSRYGSSVEVVVLEPLGGFVGGDIRAGVLAAQLSAGTDRPVLLVDMGTNAEVVLAHHRRGVSTLSVASAPAGSALEGIQVGGQRILGSEFVRTLAQARRAGALDETGLLSQAHGAVTRNSQDVLQLSTAAMVDLPIDLSRRLPFVSQLMIREFQLAKAAVRAAASGVLGAAGVEPAALDRVLVAGAFGGAISPADLVDLGMVPPVPTWRISPIGNSSLSGAVLVAMGESSGVSAAVELVDLVSSPTFTDDLVRYTSLAP